MVGEIRSISVSSPVTFSDVSAIMSDSSTGENGNELSEMQRVTLLLHVGEGMSRLKMITLTAKLTKICS